MKTRAILASTAMIFASFVPVLNGSALAAATILDPLPDPQGPSAATEAAMEAQCDALALNHGALPDWEGELDQGSITSEIVAGPTEVGTHTFASDGVGEQHGAGIFTPAHIEFTGDPYRNGGSVNMWANADSVGGHYSASTYDFEGEFETTFRYSFDCTITETVHVPVDGHYIIEPEDQGNEEQGQQSCDAFTALGPTWEHWGTDHAQCDFVVDEAAHDDEVVTTEAGDPIDETQTDTLLAHEDAGEGFDITETVSIGKVLVCISPTTSAQLKKGAPGTWVAMHGYSGEKCTTLWYNTGATAGVSNLNTGSNNAVTVPIDLP
jgi:hypothetical protein